MRTRTAVVALAAGLALAGCSSSSGGDAKASSSPSAKPAKTTAAPSSAVAAPAKPKPKPKPRSLARGPQTGLTGCIISYKDAQKGPDTSTFTALILDKTGQPYSPTKSQYDLMLNLTLTGDDGTEYPVSEALGHGSRTAADNTNGSDWFTTNQGLVEVTANSTQGMVISTLQIPLAQVKSIEGNLLITSETDDNYMKQENCAVRPA